MTSTSVTGAQLSDSIIEVYSREILFEAQPLLRFEQFVTRKEELGVMPGEQINFLRYSSIADGDTALTETSNMTKNAITASQISITVGEQGYATQFTERLLQASFDDVMASASKLLGMHYANRLDSRIRDVLLTAANVKYAGSNSYASALDGNDNFDTVLVKDMVETLATNKCPKINGDAYICFVHPHQGRYLRDDPAWINASNYGAPNLLFTGEIGRYEDVRFIETTKVTIVQTDGSIYSDGADTGLTDTDTSSVALYQALMIGDHAIGHAISLPVELRDDGIEDFGRFHSLAWYTIDGLGLIEPGHVIVGISS